jgi:hypothetical protein
VQVYVSQLSRSDENIIIAAEGLLQVTPPSEVATLLQHFSAGTLKETKRALCNIKEQQIELRKQQEAAEAAAGSSSRAAAGASSAKRKAGGEPGQQQDALAQVSVHTQAWLPVQHPSAISGRAQHMVHLTLKASKPLACSRHTRTLAST